MKAHSRETVQLAEQAADWVTRLEDEPTPACRAELVGWLRLSPQHIEEFLLAQATYRAFNAVAPMREEDLQTLLTGDAGNVVPIRETKPTISLRHGARRRMRMAAATAAVLVAAGGWLAASWFGGDVYTTAVGEQRTVRLTDGSLLAMNTNSRIRVRYSDAGRDIELLRGEALFEVTRDAQRPFKVQTPTANVQVLGTQFNVYERPEGARISVLDGLIQVTAAGNRAQSVAAGQQADVTTKGITLNPKADLTQAVAWRERRLMFRGTPLSEVVREFNRYSERPIRLQGDALGQRRISGVFHADDPGTIFKFLKTESAVTVEENPRETVIRAAR